MSLDSDKLFNLITDNTLKNGVCRVCLEPNNFLFNIFESTYHIYKPIYKIFELLFSQNIVPGDGYPEVVCPDCLGKAIRALDFKAKFHKAHQENQERNNRMINEIMDDDDEGIIIIVQNEDGESCIYQEIKQEIITDNQEIIQTESKITNNMENTQYFCQNCGIPFFTIEALSSHMVICLKCDVCEATHTNIADLKIHKNIHIKNRETICKDCGSILKRGFHSLDNFKFNCSICDYKFPCTVFLNQHIKSEHNKQINIVNKYCIEDKNNRFKCYLCSKTFSSLLRANSHMATLSCVYICDICGANYKMKSQLKMHMMDKHLGLKPYLCCVCGKSFVRKGMLKSHQQVHSKEKHFKCEMCDKKFVSAATLRYHLRLHTGEKPYMCSICGEGFVKSSRLREHEQKWHIGKLQCPKCMTTFSQRCSLKTHMDRFHPNTYNKNHNYLAKQNQQETVKDVIEQKNVLLTDLNTVYTIHITENEE